MHAATLLVLAERIQQTDRPTRTLDSEIAAALGAAHSAALASAHPAA